MRALAQRLRKLETHKLEQTVIVVHGPFPEEEEDKEPSPVSWRVFTENTNTGTVLVQPADMSFETFSAEIKQAVNDQLLIFTSDDAGIFNPSLDVVYDEEENVVDDNS